MPIDPETLRRRLGLIVGPLVFIAVLLAPAPAGLDLPAWRTAALGLLMATWWITEAIPIPATALLPLVALPVMEVVSIDEAASPYANPIIFLFMGGFMIALAMQRWDLHRRIALNLVNWVGTRPSSIVIGFILASAFLSMWVSNTATALMMLPIGLSIIRVTGDRRPAEADDPLHANFGIVLLLSIAYACNIGGVGTLIGTPPNALLAGFMAEAYGVEVGFAQWLLIGLPMVIVSLPLMYALLTWVYPLDADELPGGGDLIDTELTKIGPVTPAEGRVALIFGATALLWITRRFVEPYVPGLSDAGIAMTASLVLFLAPAGGEHRRRLLTWNEVQDLPWDILILFGGGLSLAGAIDRTGLATWIGEAVRGLSAWPLLLIVFAVVVHIILLTEITSNTATAAAFLPIMGSVAVGIGQNPFLLVVPAALGASCAFMLPVATPPNAIVYGSGLLTIPQMSRAGLWLNLLFTGLITVATYALLGWAFGVEIGTLPAWAQ